MSKKKNFEQRLKRVEDAIAMKIPDRVPCAPMVQTFPYVYAGYTMAEVMYDTSKAKTALRKFYADFEPDMVSHYAGMFIGQGEMLEKLGINWLQWAGRPGCNIDKNSIHQYIEKPYLGDDEYPNLLSDYSGWVLNKWLPRCFTSMECFSGINIPSMLSYQTISATLQFINPQIVETVKKLNEVGQKALEYYGEVAEFEKEIVEMGFPLSFGATTMTAFDNLSDTLRGTIDTMADLYDQPEYVKQAVEMFYPGTLGSAVQQIQNSSSKIVFIPLHKGLDGFMGPKQYDEFYWPTLKRLIEDLIKMDYTPLVYTEGKYDSRLETIADVTPGKCIFHFEDVDMKEAKRIVGKNHCISGGLNSRILETGTKQQVIDAVKRLLDICAPGGGYIFDLADTIEAAAKPENVEAMFDTVKTYGKY